MSASAIMPAHLLLLLVLPGLIVVSGFCTAAEVALFSLRPADEARLRRVSPWAGAQVRRLLEHPRRLLLSILLLANASNVTYFVVSAVAVQWIPSKTAQAALSILSVLGLIMLADLLPLMLARGKRVEFCRYTAGWLVGIVRVCGPVSRVLEVIAVVPATRLLRPSGAGAPEPVSAEEVGALLELSAGAGLIEEDEQRLLTEVIGLGSLRVRDVMTPRPAMAWVAESAPASRVREVVRTIRAPLPVFRGTLDGPALGFLDLWRYLPASEGDRAARPADFLSPPLFVPERASLDRVLDQFRARGEDRALCVDEYGAVVGLLTLGDIGKQVIGRPVDRAAFQQPESLVRRLGPDRWLVSGRLPARELTGTTWTPRGREGVHDGEVGRVSTVAGLILSRLGKVPGVGDQIRLGNIVLRVESMRERTIEGVMVSVEDERGGRS